MRFIKREILGVPSRIQEVAPTTYVAWHFIHMALSSAHFKSVTGMSR